MKLSSNADIKLYNLTIVAAFLENLGNFYQEVEAAFSDNENEEINASCEKEYLLQERVRNGKMTVENFYILMKRHAKIAWIRGFKTEKNLMQILDPLHDFKKIPQDIPHSLLLQNLYQIETLLMETFQSFHNCHLDDFNTYNYCHMNKFSLDQCIEYDSIVTAKDKAHETIENNIPEITRLVSEIEKYMHE